MTRPSKHFDIAMIESGKRIIIESGIKELTISNICRRADANPGMFSYCFKTKDDYLFRLISSVFAEYVTFVQIENVSDRDSLEQLKFCLLKFSEFCLPRKHLFSELFLEVSKNENLRQKALDQIKKKHILFKLVQRCLEEGYFDTTLSAMDIFAMLVIGSLQSGILCGTANDHSAKEKLQIIFRGLLKEEFRNEKNLVSPDRSWRSFLGI